MIFQKRNLYKSGGVSYYNMNKKEMLLKLIDEKKAVILQTFLDSKEEMYLKEIADKSKVSITSTFRILQEFVSIGIIGRREWKNSKVYFKEQNDKMKFVQEIFEEEYDGLPDFLKAINEIAGIQSIIRYGEKKKGKATLLLIGENIDSSRIETISQQFKEKGFEVSILPLTKEQYQQMCKMGLYSGEKVILK